MRCSAFGHRGGLVRSGYAYERAAKELAELLAKVLKSAKITTPTLELSLICLFLLAFYMVGAKRLYGLSLIAVITKES